MKRSNIIRFIPVILVLALCSFILTGCNKGQSVPLQMRQSEQDGVIARIYVKDYGKMDFVLFRDDVVAEQFRQKAESGFYDGKPVYMVIKDFCIMAGEKDTEGGSYLKDTEGSSSFYPLRGALCLTDTSGVNDTGHFTIIQADKVFLEELKTLLGYRKVTLKEYFSTAYGVDLDDETLGYFMEYGGAPWLYGHSYVFGQMTDGFETLDRIAAAGVSDDADFMPLEEIIIEKVIVN